QAARDAGDATRAEDRDAPPGVAEWVRAFSVELIEGALPSRKRPVGPGEWRVFAPADHPFGEELRAAFARLDAGRGVVVALPPAPDERHVPLLLEASHAALAGGEGFRFVLAQQEGGAASFARTLHLEAKNLLTCVVDVHASRADAAALVVSEALAARGYTEAHYDAEGVRRVPVLRALPLETEDERLPLTSDDVLVVTGGARGITAECALALARESGARLALFGRTPPGEDSEVAANLERMRASNVVARFYRVDVTDAEAVRAAVVEVEKELGAVTAVLHGAARNVPCLIRNLDAETCAATLAPKLTGARNLLAAVDPERLRIFVSFGSIIARTGLAGEADYGLANEWLARLTERWRASHKRCLCLAVEWSVWSGVGMGARLGTLDALARRGVGAVSPERGVRVLRRLLAAPAAPSSAVVMGRFRDVPTLEVERPELPFLRFLERPRVYYPGVELVVEAGLSAEADPYLDDHVFRGERLLPAVLGLEAMAQCAAALAGDEGVLAFEEVSFERPVTVGGGSTTTVRVAALAREPGRVEVVLRSSETNFQADHFRATCRLGDTRDEEASDVHEAIDVRTDAAPLVPLEPGRDLYGKVLFHRGRFRRLRGYRRLRSTDCLAEFSPDGAARWFGRYLPETLLLGDPGARDAAIHAVQACVPQVTLLPVAVGKISFGRGCADSVRARERERHADGFTYDLELLGADGRVCERWERLRLRAVGGADFRGPWPAALLGPYVERRAADLNGGAALSIAFEHDASAG
ncbi:MAG TPA: SDR family oxidoreductase, partial [Pyrinomonadaceae bacterium]|nr:SDR family oxidoreductase [Pyrinomonadaceae bacterium]